MEARTPDGLTVVAARFGGAQKRCVLCVCSTAKQAGYTTVSPNYSVRLVRQVHIKPAQTLVKAAHDQVVSYYEEGKSSQGAEFRVQSSTLGVYVHA